ncbi:MAG TPA: YbdD/YjiX family protein [Steroidobacteraceae bacterium]|nr:YbdD/YjiX family protein [Steroidobacteraceae bacterium]
MPSAPLRRLRAIGRALGDVIRGAAGADRYAGYLAHARRHHPGQQPLSREEFFRRDLSARWEGIRRCC